MPPGDDSTAKPLTPGKRLKNLVDAAKLDSFVKGAFIAHYTLHSDEVLQVFQNLEEFCGGAPDADTVRGAVLQILSVNGAASGGVGGCMAGGTCAQLDDIGSALRGTATQLSTTTVSAPQLKATAMSSVGSTKAKQVISSMDIPIVDGNMVEPITPPENGFPDIAPFSMHAYGDEKQATPGFIKYLQDCLAQLGVVFGRDGLQFVNVHNNKKMLTLQTEQEQFKGYLDAVVVPYGVLSYSSGMRLAVELKYTEQDKKAYRAGFKLKSKIWGQAVMELLSTYSVAHYPPDLVITEGYTYHVMRLRSRQLIIWQELTPGQAIFHLSNSLKQPECVLRNPPPSTDTQTPDAGRVALHFMRKFNPSTVIREQAEDLMDLDDGRSTLEQGINTMQLMTAQYGLDNVFAALVAPPAQFLSHFS